ncbi:hypothetical protein B0T14DRAFT_138251 [Immersiella caudata]|uniref:Uncharacterized protein n=1 Tax=Immersiella caudata TaxID=314043 RepID=A0AA39X567_9PEZI|nr:hypothetical protein B0T14DRAFT_138251 [Immersiella caudata]
MCGSLVTARPSPCSILCTDRPSRVSCPVFCALWDLPTALQEPMSCQKKITFQGKLNGRWSAGGYLCDIGGSPKSPSCASLRPLPNLMAAAVGVKNPLSSAAPLPSNWTKKLAGARLALSFPTLTSPTYQLRVRATPEAACLPGQQGFFFLGHLICATLKIPRIVPTTECVPPANRRPYDLYLAVLVWC